MNVIIRRVKNGCVLKVTDLIDDEKEEVDEYYGPSTVDILQREFILGLRLAINMNPAKSK
jgi:hypothetical protein